MSESLKTHFVVLNFFAPAATWFQTLELRGRLWIGKLCVLLCVIALIRISNRTTCANWICSDRPVMSPSTMWRLSGYPIRFCSITTPMMMSSL